MSGEGKTRNNLQRYRRVVITGPIDSHESIFLSYLSVLCSSFMNMLGLCLRIKSNQLADSPIML